MKKPNFNKENNSKQNEIFNDREELKDFPFETPFKVDILLYIMQIIVKILIIFFQFIKYEAITLTKKVLSQGIKNININYRY